MGFKLLVGSHEFESADFSVQESATPLAAGDSSGAVGTFTVSIPQPDPYAETAKSSLLTALGPTGLQDLPVRLSDTRKGFTLGRVTSSSPNMGSGTIQLSVDSRLADLNIYHVQAPPIVGTLAEAFAAYLAIAEITEDYYVDPAIASRQVVFPGWHGELWYHLKQMAVAMDCDISLVSGIIVLRPIRTRVATRGRDVDRSLSAGGGSLAQFVEVYQYNNRVIENELVYPPGGWTEEIPVITVASGEYIEETLELSASVTSISQPVMQEFVSRDHDSSSVFTVVGDDGFPITAAAWQAWGGYLWVDINEDTTSLTVKIQAPSGLYNRDGAEIQTYGIALSSDTGTGRYSTLRIIGSGVAFLKELRRVPTGIPQTQAASEVGATVDNPFLSTSEEVNRAAARAAREYNGTAMRLSGTVISVNQLGDTGTLVSSTYGDVEAELSGMSYEDVEEMFDGFTYEEVVRSFNEGRESEFENQVFGNVNGARVWDEPSRRWYRIRSATITPGTIGFEAEDDLNYEDMFPVWEGKTYEQVEEMYEGLTYKQVTMMGVRDV